MASISPALATASILQAAFSSAAVYDTCVDFADFAPGFCEGKNPIQPAPALDPGVDILHKRRPIGSCRYLDGSFAIPPSDDKPSLPPGAASTQLDADRMPAAVHCACGRLTRSQHRMVAHGTLWPGKKFGTGPERVGRVGQRRFWSPVCKA